MQASLWLWLRSEVGFRNRRRDVRRLACLVTYLVTFVTLASSLVKAGSALAQGREGTQLPTLNASSAMQGGGFFNGRDLDFWSQGKRVPPYLPSDRSPEAVGRPVDALPPPSGSIIRRRDALPFEWSRYQDPKNPEFWDDGGDYVAPRPLREAIANPTSQNLEAYLAWQAKRLDVVAAFDAKLAQSAVASLGKQLPALAAGTAAAALEGEAKASPIRWHELDLLYFYQSSCPHCIAAKEQVEGLARRGVRVTFIQLDAGEQPPLHRRSVPYTRAHSDQFRITATPTWVFRRRSASARLQGAQSEGELLTQISTLFSVSRNPQQQRNPQ